VRNDIDILLPDLLTEKAKCLDEMGRGEVGAFAILVVFEQVTGRGPGKNQNRSGEIGVIGDLRSLEQGVGKRDVVAMDEEQEAVRGTLELPDKGVASKPGRAYRIRIRYIMEYNYIQQYQIVR
jgi:hypothetical protein